MTEPSKPITTTRRKLLEYWWIAPVAAVGGFFAWFGLRSYRILLGKPTPSSQPNFKAGARVAIGTLEEFPKLWDARTFDYGDVQAIVVRVKEPQPGGITVNGTHLIGLSRGCTHLKCTCEYIRSPEIASMAYKYRPEFDHPVLGCACHFSAFDPELAGKSVSGPALDPLPRIKLEARGDQIFAVGLEKA
jgi:arsenite oxidase small subunit